MRTAFSGAPRWREHADDAPDAPGHTAESVIRRAWWVGIVGSALFLASASGILYTFMEGRVSGTGVGLFVAVPALVVTVLLLVLRVLARRRGHAALGFLRLAAFAATATLLFAIVGHLLHPRGVPLRPYAPGVGVWGVGDIILLTLGAFAPLMMGVFAHTAGRALDIAGVSTWRLALGSFRRIPDDVRPHHRGSPLAALGGLVGRTVEGIALPGLLALDVAHTLVQFARTRVTGVATARIHVRVRLETLLHLLDSADLTVEPGPEWLLVTLPREPGMVNDPQVRIRWDELAFPPCTARDVLELRGERAHVRMLQRVLEHVLGFHGLVTWTSAARRIEAMLNALAREAHAASTLEERGALSATLDDLERVITRRGLLADERTTLLAWKLAGLRAMLQAKMLEETGHGGPRARLAPAPALAPELARILDAGGLDAAGRLVYVPYHLVPVWTTRGEVEVVVNAITQRLDAAESHDLLRAARERPPTLELEGAAPALVRSVKPTAAIVGEARAALRKGRRIRTRGDVEAVETLYVPFVESADGWRNAVTGREVPGLENELAKAVPREA